MICQNIKSIRLSTVTERIQVAQYGWVSLLVMALFRPQVMRPIRLGCDRCVHPFSTRVPTLLGFPRMWIIVRRVGENIEPTAQAPTRIIHLSTSFYCLSIPFTLFLEALICIIR